MYLHYVFLFMFGNIFCFNLDQVPQHLSNADFFLFLHHYCLVGLFYSLQMTLRLNMQPCFLTMVGM